MACQLKDGRMACHVVIKTGIISCERFDLHEHGEPGTSRRKALGFYDPMLICEQHKPEVEPLKSGKLLRDVLVEGGLMRAHAKGLRSAKRHHRRPTSPSHHPHSGCMKFIEKRNYQVAEGR